MNAVAPFDLAGKPDVAIAVDNRGVWSAPVLTPVVPARPAAFPRGSLAAALNQDGSVNDEANPAPRGSLVALFVTGLGALASPVDDGAIAASTTPGLARMPEVLVAGQPAAAEYAGPAPGLVYGVFQINLRIPAAVSSGLLPLTIRSEGAESPAGARLAIR